MKRLCVPAARDDRAAARRRVGAVVMTNKPDATTGAVTIKKYANRRLYDTEVGGYVTLLDLATMIKEGRDFVVIDAKSGDDITHAILTSIIVEKEAQDQALLPVSFLRQMIGFYGDILQTLVPRYLEQSMQAFSLHQEQMRAYAEQASGSMAPFTGLEDLGKQNEILFAWTRGMFAPYSIAATAEREARENGDERDAAIADLLARMDDVQR